MNNYRANENDQMRAENIRRQYVGREDDRLEQLKKLDNKVKMPGKAAAGALGVIGALVMGSALVMVWENMRLGLALGIPGLIVVLLAYPLYAQITGNRKKKYAAEIIRLSDGVASNESRIQSLGQRMVCGNR